MTLSFISVQCKTAGLKAACYYQELLATPVCDPRKKQHSSS
jgi:hypothetical protein